MVRFLLAVALVSGLTLGSLPRAEAALEYRVKSYDAYDPSTPYLYRRTRPKTTCQLAPNLQGTPPAANEFQGWILPSLIWGYCPLRFEMLNPKNESVGIFGPTGRN